MGARGGLPAGEADGRVVGTLQERKGRGSRATRQGARTPPQLEETGKQTPSEPPEEASSAGTWTSSPGRPQLTSDLQPARE